MEIKGKAINPGRLKDEFVIISCSEQELAEQLTNDEIITLLAKKTMELKNLPTQEEKFCEHGYLRPSCTFCKSLKPSQAKNTFYDEVKHLINKMSLENASNTPDFILAEFLQGCLNLLDNAIYRREKWYSK